MSSKTQDKKPATTADIDDQIAALQAQRVDVEHHETFVSEFDKADTDDARVDALLRSMGMSAERRLRSQSAAGASAILEGDFDPVERAQDALTNGEFVEAMIYAGIAQARKSIAA